MRLDGQSGGQTIAAIVSGLIGAPCSETCGESRPITGRDSQHEARRGFAWGGRE